MTEISLVGAFAVGGALLGSVFLGPSGAVVGFAIGLIVGAYLNR